MGWSWIPLGLLEERHGVVLDSTRPAGGEAWVVLDSTRPAGGEAWGGPNQSSSNA